MLNSDSDIPRRASSDTPPYSKAKETFSTKIAELNESRSELQTRIQSLKQDLQGWRSKLDTQVKNYRDELSELKKSLNVEVEQLRSEFQELRTTLQQQQEDVEASLRDIGLQDVSIEGNIAKAVKIEEGMDKAPKAVGGDHITPSNIDDVKPQI